MGKVWFSRGRELRDPICRLDAELTIATVAETPRPLWGRVTSPQWTRETRVADQPMAVGPQAHPDSGRPSRALPRLDDLARRLLSEQARSERAGVPAAALRGAQRWNREEADTEILEPLWVQHTLPSLPSLSSLPDTVPLEPVDLAQELPDPDPWGPPRATITDESRRPPVPVPAERFDPRRLLARAPLRRRSSSRPAAAVALVVLFNALLTASVVGAVLAWTHPGVFSSFTGSQNALHANTPER